MDSERWARNETDSSPPEAAQLPDAKSRHHVEGVPDPSGPPAPAGASIQHLTDRALDFLSTASNETIGACLVGLGAVLHATWDGNAGSNAEGGSKAVEEKRRKETGLDVIHRVLKWRAQGLTTSGEDDDEPNYKASSLALSEADLNFADFKPETADALRQITDAVIRDYVKWWYSPILPEEPLFPDASRETLTAFVRSISNNLARKRPADTFLNFVTNASSVVVVFFAELSAAIYSSPNMTPVDAVHAYLKAKPESNLAHVMDRTQQRKKLYIVADDILQGYLEPKTYNCRPAQVFLRQILSTTVLNNTIESCSRPEWINDWIVHFLEDGEPQLMKKVDAGLEGPNGSALENVKGQLANGNLDSMETRSKEAAASEAAHRRVVSRGQEAFDEAMRHVAELNRMIQEEDETRRQTHGDQAESIGEDKALSALAEAASDQNREKVTGAAPFRSSVGTASVTDDVSETTTQGAHTPASSQGDDSTTAETGLEQAPPPHLRTDLTDSLVESETKSPTTFTNFDQILPNIQDIDSAHEKEPLTVYKANLAIFDDSLPGDKASIKAKPQEEYLIQIEPASTNHSGWMVARKYPEFEPLHQAIFAISKISGAGFDKLHPTLPIWKGHTKSQLRESLEKYLNDAVACQSIAESERMKRFLDRDQNLIKTPSKGNQFFENVGKGMITGITTAGKEVAGGGKAIIGVFGGIGSQKKPTVNTTGSTNGENGSAAIPHNRTESIMSTTSKARQSTDNLSFTSSRTGEPRQSIASPIRERKDLFSNGERDAQMRMSTSSRPDVQPSSSGPSPVRRRAAKPPSMELSVSAMGDELISLPPPPSQMMDDYDGASETTATSSPTNETRRQEGDSVFSESTAATSMYDALPSSPVEEKAPTLPARPNKIRKDYAPLSIQETTVSIELLFAVITELYTLSSAWSLRRTLLNAAKTFLLRPGNPQLESIRQLLQSTVLDANTSDAGIATHLLKLRENSLPTPAELALWPKELTDEEKDKRRAKARKLLVEKGMPVALTSVMGQAASGEALGKVFDCLQDKEVARGLIFGLMLQGIRAVVQ